MLSDKKNIKVQSSPIPNILDFDNNENQNEDFENDIYLIELHKRLTNMKKERKKAELDAQLLDNRLNLLKGEEEKVSIYHKIYNRPGKKLKLQKRRHRKRL
jgi:hypothetical protein